MLFRELLPFRELVSFREPESFQFLGYFPFFGLFPVLVAPFPVLVAPFPIPSLDPFPIHILYNYQMNLYIQGNSFYIKP